MNAKLVILSGPDHGLEFPLSAEQAFVIGRGSATHVKLTDLYTSRVHCVVVPLEDGFTISDCKGKGGTRINGELLQKQTLLKAGDIIRIGRTQIRFKFGETMAIASSLARSRAKEKARRPREAAPQENQLAGALFGHFRLEEEIARGVSGRVFKAVDVRRQQPAAVKILLPSFAADRTRIARFLKSMRAAIRIRHPHVVSIYLAGKKGPYCWVAMEYVEGESVMDLIVRHGTAKMLDWTTAFRLALHMAMALDEAWRLKVMHRNLTPRNILYSRPENAFKLNDLTLARALDSGGEPISAARPEWGELAFVSPEATRAHHAIDVRSDLYSLGAVVFMVLTGRPPFEADAWSDLAIKIRSEKPPGLKQYQLSIPDLFESLVLNLLEKRPEFRPQTPAQLLAQLVRIGGFHGLEV